MTEKAQPKWDRFQRLKRSAFTRRARTIEVATLKHAHRFIVERWQHAKEVRQHIGLWLAGIGILIGAAIIQFVMFQSNYSTVAAADKGTYAEGVSGLLTTLNPLYAGTEPELSFSRLVFSSLFDYDETGALRGDLATTYKTEDNGKKYIVSLRKNAYWHDGRPVSAHDVAFTIGLIKKPATGSPLNGSWQDVSVQVKDASTLEFTLPSAYSPFPNALTFAVLPKHLLENINPNDLRSSQFSSQPVGSGPFKYTMQQQIGVTKGSAAQHVHSSAYLSRNETYYRGKPKLERFQLHAYSSQDDLMHALESREVNAISGVSVGKISASLRKNYTLHSTPINAAVFMIFNTRQANLADVKMRQAFQKGINVDEALKLLAWQPRRVDTPFTQSQVDVSEVKKPAVDAAGANQQLDELGWKLDGAYRKKDGQILQLRMAYVKDSDYEVLVKNLTNQFAKLGVKIEARAIDTTDPTQNIASTVLQPRDYDILLHELMIGADPDVYAYWHSSQAVARGLNLANYSDGVSDDLLSSARTRVEPALRQAKYIAFAKQWVKNAPAIGLYQSNTTYAQSYGTKSSPDDATFISPLDRYSNINQWSARQGIVYKTP
jgi:peptide/nickel transport system substrate-binding protein